MTLEQRVEATRYEITNYPQESVNAPHYTLYVERRGPGKWCVTDGAFCYTRDGQKEYEALPGSRTGEFKDATRFTLEDALEIAKRIQPTMTINGITAEECWEWEQKQLTRER